MVGSTTSANMTSSRLLPRSGVSAFQVQNSTLTNHHSAHSKNMGAPNTIPSDFDSFSLLQPPSPPASSPSSTLREKGMIYLPEGYIPGPCDVICQRGKDCHEHIGNRRFRACVENFVDIYLNAKTRQEKSAVISNIVKMINENDNNKQGGFIMKDPKAQRWHHVDIKVARDKVGNALRDAMKQRQEGKPATSLSPLNNPSVSQMSRDLIPSWTTTSTTPSRATDHLNDATSCVDEPLARLVHSSSHNVLPTPGRTEPGAIAMPTENLFLYPRQVKEQSLEQTPQLLAGYNILNQAQNGPHGNHHQLIHLPLDQSFFSLTSTMEPQSASDVLASTTFNMARNLLPFEALVDSMDVDEFEDFEPRPIGAMFSL